MKAGKAYISSLGTTGLLIASSVLLLMVVGTLVAFDGWPSGSAGGAEEVAIGEAEPIRPARSASAERREARAERRRAAAERGRAARVRSRRAARTATGEREARGAPADAVVSDLPAPDSDPNGGRPQGGGAADGVGTRSGGSSGDGPGGGPATGPVGDALTGVSPQAGAAVNQVGEALGVGVDQNAPALSP